MAVFAYVMNETPLLPVQQRLFFGGGGGGEKPATFCGRGIEPLLPREGFALLVSDPLFPLFFSFCLFLFASKRIITFFKNMSFNDLSSRMFGGLCPVLTEFSLEYLLRCFSRLKYKFFEFIVAFEILRVSLLHNIQFL